MSGAPKIEISEIKRLWPILAYALFFVSDYKFVGTGPLRIGRCPWRPKCDMILDLGKNIFRVFNGGEVETGDVLDWEMHRSKLPDRAAAAAVLAAYQEQVQVPWH